MILGQDAPREVIIVLKYQGDNDPYLGFACLVRYYPEADIVDIDSSPYKPYSGDPTQEFIPWAPHYIEDVVGWYGCIGGLVVRLVDGLYYWVDRDVNRARQTIAAPEHNNIYTGEVRHLCPLPQQPMHIIYGTKPAQIMQGF